MQNAKNVFSRESKIVLGIILVLVASVLLFVFFMHGKTTFVNSGVKIEDSDSISCISKSVKYPFTGVYEDSELSVKILFNNGKAETISLVNVLYLDSVDDAKKAAAACGAAMDIRFGKDGLSANSFSATYASSDNKMTMTLYTHIGEVQGVSKKYFLLDDINEGSSMDEYVSGYEKMGFECSKKE